MPLYLPNDSQTMDIAARIFRGRLPRFAYLRIVHIKANARKHTQIENEKCMDTAPSFLCGL